MAEWLVCWAVGHGIILFLATREIYPDRFVASMITKAAEAPVWAAWIISGAFGLLMTFILEIFWNRRSSLASAALLEATAKAVPNAADAAPTIQTGIGGSYDLRNPSQDGGGAFHVIRVKITNATEKILTNARLSVVNLNPANAGFHDFKLENGIALAPGDSTYIKVASHTEGIATSQIMCLQTSYPGGFVAPTGFGILTGEHRLQLRLTQNETRLAEIYCRLYVDDHNVMRLGRLDKCETL